MDDKQIDRLTADLMKGTIEKPSASLMGRIMVRVMQQQQTTRKIQVSKSPVLKWLFGGMFIYIILAIGTLFFFLSTPPAITEIGETLKEILPIALLLSGGISVFIIFTHLDNWLRIHKDFRTNNN